MTSLLQIGLEPAQVDYTGDDYQALGPLSVEWMRATLREDLALLHEAGVEVDLVFISPAEPDLAEVEAKLAQRRYDTVMIGGGLRLFPERTELFERVVALTRTASPGSRLIFSATPKFTRDEVDRWFGSPDIAGVTQPEPGGIS